MRFRIQNGTGLDHEVRVANDSIRIGSPSSWDFENMGL
jgi:hypothetical protein